METKSLQIVFEDCWQKQNEISVKSVKPYRPSWLIKLSCTFSMKQLIIATLLGWDTTTFQAFSKSAGCWLNELPPLEVWPSPSSPKTYDYDETHDMASSTIKISNLFFQGRTLLHGNTQWKLESIPLEPKLPPTFIWHAPGKHFQKAAYACSMLSLGYPNN